MNRSSVISELFNFNTQEYPIFQKLYTKITYTDSIFYILTVQFEIISSCARVHSHKSNHIESMDILLTLCCVHRTRLTLPIKLAYYKHFKALLKFMYHLAFQH